MEQVELELGGLNNETYQDLDDDETFQTWFIFSRVLVLIMTLLGICSSSLIMHAIQKTSKLNTRANHYIFHMLLCLVIYFIVQNLTIALYCIIFHTWYISDDVMYVVWNVEEVAFTLTLTFASALGLDWYAITFNKKSLIQFQQKSYKYIICLLYLIAIVKIILYPAVDFQVLLISFPASCIMVTICNLIMYCSSINVEANYSNSLQVANVTVYSWSPLAIYIMIFAFSTDDQMRFLEESLFATLFIPQIVICCIPVMLLFILKHSDKDFEAAFAILLHKKQSYEYNQLLIREDV